MLKIERLKTLATFALLSAVGLACGQVGSPGEPTTLKSPDGKFQITVPGGWKAGSLAAGEIIRAQNNQGEMVVTVASKSKADLADDPLDKFTEGARKGLLSKLNGTDATEPESLTVNGNNARQFEAKIDNREGSVLATIIDTSQDIYVIMAIAHKSQYDENKATLKRISESFRAVSASGSDSNTSSSN